jgi:glycosyltransferase involved in cell wall biosynthesis
VLHASNPPDNVWIAALAVGVAQRGRPLFVFDQHDVAPVLLAEKFGSRGILRTLRWLAGFLEGMSFRRADLVLFASSEYAVRAEEQGLLASPSAVVRNGWALPTDLSDIDWRRGRTELVAYVGAISEQDGVEQLVDAAVLLANRDLRIVVAGDGSALDAVKMRAETVGVSHLFQWLGWESDRQRLGSLVASANVCVVPEVETEFNRLASLVKLAEYMSAGRAIAAHRLPQTEALAGDAVAYAPDMSAASLGQTIQRLLDDARECERLGAAARLTFLERVAWDSVGGKALTDAYRQLSQSSRGVPLARS